jgi:hypothetical protein
MISKVPFDSLCSFKTPSISWTTRSAKQVQTQTCHGNPTGWATSDTKMHGISLELLRDTILLVWTCHCARRKDILCLLGGGLVRGEPIGRTTSPQPRPLEAKSEASTGTYCARLTALPCSNSSRKSDTCPSVWLAFGSGHGLQQ